MSEDEGEKSCDTKETNEMALGVVLGVEGLRMMDLQMENKNRKKKSKS